MRRADSRSKICHLAVVHKADDKRIFQRECRSLAKMGYEVHIIAPFRHDDVIENVIIHALPDKNGQVSRIINMFRLLLMSLKLKADIYHFHDPILIYVGFCLRVILKVPVVYDIHEWVEIGIMEKKNLPFVLRRLLSWAYAVTCKLLARNMSKVAVLEEIAEDYDGDVRIVKNYCPISISDSKWKNEDSFSVKEDHTAKAFRLIYVGGVTEQRGGLTMVELVRELVSHYNLKVRLDIFGSFFPKGFQADVKDCVRKYNLDPYILLQGNHHFANIIPYLNRADIALCLWNPTEYKFACLPVKLTEYMEFGIPILSCTLDSWKPYIEEVGSGIMVDPSDIVNCARIVNDLLLDYKCRQDMGQKGRNAVLKYFNWEKEVAKLDRLYRDLLTE